MDFLSWRKAVLDSVEEIGLRPTAKRFKIGVSSLQLIMASEESGDGYAGLNTWKRNGALLKVLPNKPSPTNRLKDLKD